jgi:hypothetical protein
MGCPAIITGYARHLARPSQRHAISRARAQQVANHVVVLARSIAHNVAVAARRKG